VSEQARDKIRLSAVSFLNTRPITYGLERAVDGQIASTGLGSAERSHRGGERKPFEGSPLFDLSFDLPSRCADRLAAGEVDLGLIPVGAYATSEAELRIVPGIAIASHGPVRTVLLVSETPWEELEEIALDGASRSSALLLRLLCHERGLTPRWTSWAAAPARW